MCNVLKVFDKFIIIIIITTEFASLLFESVVKLWEHVKQL